MRLAGAPSREVIIPIDGRTLRGSLALPPSARGLVLFAHGSGSSRRSPRNQYVASVMRQASLGTLLLDLLTEAEAPDREKVFDIELLAGRLLAAMRRAHSRLGTSSLAMGLFGASTGAAAALVAAAHEPRVRALVSRGGRPDLASAWLARVTAPTLLIVGSEDSQVLRLNRLALSKLGGTSRLSIVPGASHLFEEKGALEQAAALAREWFSTQLVERGVYELLSVR